MVQLPDQPHLLETMTKPILEGSRPKIQDSRLKIQNSLHPRSCILDLVPSTFLVPCILCLVFIFSYSSETSLRASSISSPELDKKSVWVFFTDKGTFREGDLRAAVDQCASRLPTRTGARRQKAQGRTMDISDLPVFQPYIGGVLQLGATLRVTSRWLNGVTVEVPHDAVPQILQLPYIEAVEPIATYRRSRSKTQDPRLKTEAQQQSRPRYAPGIQYPVHAYGTSATQIQQIHVDALHNRGYHGEGITIAILDTGFDLSHEAFRNIRVLAQYDFVNGDGETSDHPPADDIGQDNHGTEVLSIIAGNSPGNLMGVAYAAEYLLAKTERVSLRGAMFEQQVEEDWWVAGLEWAELNGADVVSSSLGYSDWYTYSDIDGATAKTTIAANMAVQKGVIIVVSAGNEGKSRDWPYISAPADGLHIIAVGAVDSGGRLADFSSIGPTYDGRIKPDVVAMGENSYVVDPNSVDAYREADGTSMATPLVAGTAALLLQALNSPESSSAKRELYGPKDIAKLLKYTASHALSPDNRYGWGIINAEAAYRYGTSPDLMEELDDWNPGTQVFYPHRSAIVYPNPVRRSSLMSRLNIQSLEPMESIEIYSISGLLIHRRDTAGARFSIWDLRSDNGEEVAGGIYFCVIKSSTGNIELIKMAVID